ncbi:uncharacterized protein BXZ73DRAFT_81100 [Epithele typhae]|uniref:uncharacterized protein n=1 Tax=Epithele typhae TaxID=378194 RepID=UPI0020086342|nr:uncharacterized protein BXZ73DRAFT_81100 [Epithele typhae]KAH9916418.1 hypothetical protein BXZ73DRAFT_81100 [Epithele typhae]
MAQCGQTLNEVDEKPPTYQAHDDADTNLAFAHAHGNSGVCTIATAFVAPSNKPSPPSRSIWRVFSRVARPVKVAAHVVVTLGAKQVVGSYPSVPPEVIGVVPNNLLQVLIPLTPLEQESEVFGSKFWHTLVDAFGRAEPDGSVPRLEAALLKCYYDWRLNFSVDSFELVQRDGSVARLEAALLKSCCDWRLADGQARCYVEV